MTDHSGTEANHRDALHTHQPPHPEVLDREAIEPRRTLNASTAEERRPYAPPGVILRESGGSLDGAPTFGGSAAADDPPVEPEDDGCGESGGSKQTERTTAVWTALSSVTDPELDQSIVDLGFVTRVSVEAGRVAVDFRLPTFWCSANFAWMIAEDMTTALSRLAWADEIRVRLLDHFAATKINAGIAADAAFATAFAGEATGDLAAVRRTFAEKALAGRMSALIGALRDAGWSSERVTAATVADIAALKDGPSGKLAQRFLEMRATLDGPLDLSAPAFREADGNAIASERLAAFLRDIRMTRRSVEANAEMCRMLLKARQEGGAME